MFGTRSYFAVYVGVTNLERRQLIAHRKEETGHPDTFSGEKTTDLGRDGKEFLNDVYSWEVLYPVTYLI